MQIDNDGLQLTYCTNIHPGDGWAQVEGNIRRFAPALKAKLCPSAPFGLGLRLSAREAREVLDGDRLEWFRSWLEDQGLYVALINGFPYGPFHGTPVKASVYAPDWRDDARVRYTLDLIEILSRLLPDGMEGGISTVPLSYRAWLDQPEKVPATLSRSVHAGLGELAAGAARPREKVPGTFAGKVPATFGGVAANLVRLAEALVRVRRERRTFIHLDIEPEPDCVLETTGESIAFFEQSLLPVGIPVLAAALGVSETEARAELLQHIQICFDCCHAAVEFEDARAALDRLGASGVRIGRIQLSSALDVRVPADVEARAKIAARLRPFADATYLHQVVARHDDGTLSRFPDLPAALEAPSGADARWRIHFHVPLFTSEFEGLGSTQGYVADAIDYARRTHCTRHLEIETYTWDVLPAGLKLDVAESIEREYAWVLRTARQDR